MACGECRRRSALVEQGTMVSASTGGHGCARRPFEMRNARLMLQEGTDSASLRRNVPLGFHYTQVFTRRELDYSDSSVDKKSLNCVHLYVVELGFRSPSKHLVRVSVPFIYFTLWYLPFHQRKSL